MPRLLLVETADMAPSRLFPWAEESWQVELLSSPAQIEALAKQAQPLLARLPASAGPRFFLASATPRGWSPRVVVVRQSQRILGLVYVRERRLPEAPVEMLLGNSTLGTLVAAEPGRQESVLAQAVDFLLASKPASGIRILVPCRQFEGAIKGVARRHKAEFQYRADPGHQSVPLADSYASFLESLNAKGRRNLRYYRRRSEAAGHCFVERMDLAEFARVAPLLIDKSVVGGGAEGVSRAINMLSEAEQPILAGLRRADGEYLAILGGWCEGARPIVFFQMNNDRDYKADSLPAVLRGYVMEALITRGCRDLIFWAGATGPVPRIAPPQAALAISLGPAEPRWQAFRESCIALAPALPGKLQRAMDWVTPARRPPGGQAASTL